MNLENAAVQKRVGKINGGVQILKAVGFTPSEDVKILTMLTIDDAVLQNALDQLAPHID